MSAALMVSRVQMPEGGVFLVRVDEALLLSGAVAEGAQGRFVVALDYGEDVGTVLETVPYDSALHGPRIPGFRLVRAFTPEDGQAVAANVARAAEMREVFLSAARETVPDVRVPSIRLSLGRRKLFIRYATEQAHPDLSAAGETLAHRFGVSVNLWAMGPRDEVAELGGIGPCGRVCCCSSWQKHYPSHLAPDRRNVLPSLMNGTCGRFKCCLAFERDV